MRLGAGITILQMSKVDPTTLSGLDRKTTILLAANRSTQDAEKGDLNAVEEPGVDAIRGSFGTFGSIVRARSARRMSQHSSVGTVRSRRAAHGHTRDDSTNTLKTAPSLGGMKRHQLFDNPVPPLPEDAAERISMHSNVASPRGHAAIPQSPKKSTTIQFRQQDLAGHDHPDPTDAESRQSLALDDFIQRTVSPVSAPAGISSRPLYDDPFVPRTAAAGYNSYQLRQDSLTSFTEPNHGRESVSPDGADTPPQTPGTHGRFQRSYPHDREMDREESMSLVGGARELGTDPDVEGAGITSGGIRLVPSLPRR
ncbi:hypothetical protein FRC08_013817 [Ceratobasidium sp. 394]|nr:hypothetical protein FRC08_013817 [Ceratobasidium sp. 394]